MRLKKASTSYDSGFRYEHDCEGCGNKIKKEDKHYMISFGTGSEVLVVPLGEEKYYHETCFEPYMITLWLQEGNAVAVSLHTD